MRKYFYQLLRKYISLLILPQNSVVEIDATTELLVGSMPNGRVAFRDTSHWSMPTFPEDRLVPLADIKELRPDYLVLSGVVHYERDIQRMLSDLHALSHAETRLIITYFSSLWRPFTTLASWLGLREKTPETNWLAHEDIGNLLTLSSFELVRWDSKILLPIYIPLLSNFVNRYIAPLPFFRIFSLVNIAVARPLLPNGERPSVSIVVPARNEAGNIQAIVERVPAMGPNDELILVEGNSTDDTWDVVQRVHRENTGARNIVICQQEGKGKGDAVRKGFSLARNDILMILDADMTVPPEDLPKFLSLMHI